MKKEKLIRATASSIVFTIALILISIFDKETFCLFVEFKNIIFISLLLVITWYYIIDYITE